MTFIAANIVFRTTFTLTLLGLCARFVFRVEQISESVRGKEPTVACSLVLETTFALWYIPLAALLASNVVAVGGLENSMSIMLVESIDGSSLLTQPQTTVRLSA